MKKLFFLTLMVFTINAYSQNGKYDDGVYSFPQKDKTQIVSKPIAKQLETYLSKSANYQYGAIGCAGVSAGLLIGYGSLKDKFELNDRDKAKMTNKAKGMIIGGSIFALAAIVLEINAINYKTKAGKCLQLQATENGAGLAFVF